MWVRVEYRDHTGNDRGYTAWVSSSLDDWLFDHGITRENIHRLWINDEEVE